MGLLSKVLRNAAGNRLVFWCPGCDRAHQIVHGASGWSWDGNAERPTFSPSVLVTWEEGEQRIPRVCHSFVREGRIQFLNDCTHRLAGQTVDLPDWPRLEWEG